MLHISNFIFTTSIYRFTQHTASQQSVWWRLCQTTQCQFNSFNILHIFCLETIRSRWGRLPTTVPPARQAPPTASKDLVAQKVLMRKKNKTSSGVIRVATSRCGSRFYATYLIHTTVDSSSVLSHRRTTTSLPAPRLFFTKWFFCL